MKFAAFLLVGAVMRGQVATTAVELSQIAPSNAPSDPVFVMVDPGTKKLTYAHLGAGVSLAQINRVWTITGQTLTADPVYGQLAISSTPTSITIAAGSWGVGNQTCIIQPVTANVLSFAVVGAAGSPIVLTISGTLAGLVNANTVNVTGVLGDTAANGLWPVLLNSPTQLTLVGSTSNAAYTGGGTLAGTGNGIVLVEGRDDCSIGFYHSSSAGLLVGITGTGIANQSVSPQPTLDGTPLAQCTVTAGQIVGCIDKRRWQGNRGIVAGVRGISVTDLGGVAQVSADPTTPNLDEDNVFTGLNTMSGIIFQPLANQPPCDVRHRGTIWSVQSASGDQLQVCQMTAAGVLAWVNH